MTFWIVLIVALIVALYLGWMIARFRAIAPTIPPSVSRQQARILSQVDRGMLRYHHTEIDSIRHTGGKS